MPFINHNSVQPAASKTFNYSSWAYSNQLSVDDNQLSPDLGEHVVFSQDVEAGVVYFGDGRIGLKPTITTLLSRINFETLDVIGFLHSDSVLLSKEKLISLLNLLVKVDTDSTHSTEKSNTITLNTGINIDPITLVFDTGDTTVYLTFNPLSVGTNEYILSVKSVLKDLSSLSGSISQDVNHNTIIPANAAIGLRVNYSLELLRQRFIAANIALVQNNVISQQFSDRLIQTSVNIGLFGGVFTEGVIGDDNMIFELLTIYSICKWSINDLDTPSTFDINPNANLNIDV